jgi:hypothetical protein
MTLVVQWWLFVPFGQRGRVLNTLPVNHPQCPFIQMTDTDVTFLSCYTIVGHTRMHVMTLTSPPSLPLSRPWGFYYCSTYFKAVRGGGGGGGDNGGHVLGGTTS